MVKRLFPMLVAVMLLAQPVSAEEVYPVDIVTYGQCTAVVLQITHATKHDVDIIEGLTRQLANMVGVSSNELLKVCIGALQVKGPYLTNPAFMRGIEDVICKVRQYQLSSISNAFVPGATDAILLHFWKNYPVDVRCSQGNL